MAWNEINHSCGHTQRVQLYGKMIERERRVEWMERGVCPECFRAQKETERSQENERAGKLVTEIGFVALVGSEKQIAWGNALRQKAFEGFLADNTNLADRKMMVKVINLETSSKWWIDNRSNGWVAITKIIMGNYPSKIQELKNKKEIAA